MASPTVSSDRADGRAPRSPWRIRTGLPGGVIASYVAKTLAIVVLAFLSYRSLVGRRENAEVSDRTSAALDEVERVLSSLKDAETGQRGYLLTGEEDYLEPYRTAVSTIPMGMANLRALLADDPSQAERIALLAKVADDRLDELRQTIELARDGKHDAALAILRTDRGEILMDTARSTGAQIERHERERVDVSERERADSIGTTALITWVGLGLLLALLAASAWTSSRSFREREVLTWARVGETALAARLAGNQEPAEIADRAIRFLAEYLEAPVGAVHVVGDDGVFRRLGAFALTTRVTRSPDPVTTGEGLVGQAARENRMIALADVPASYFTVESGLGASLPRQLVVVPAHVDGEVNAVIELGFFREVGVAERRLLDRAAGTIAIALRAASFRAAQAELLAETQRQAEELQQTQLQLENQQHELEETNSQLEEQTQTLELQKDGLVATRQALENQAAELERASRYKSEFLANMSHELRTPLNSLLILAKLLTDNKDRNLTDEQVRYAQSITSAGNDLLALINDILDLSKIEARRVDLEIERVTVTRLFDDLRHRFEPLAHARGLELVLVSGSDCPSTIETDRQRMLQILGNLVSNAIKFTERGRVVVSAAAADHQRVAFVVEDTGIGIAAEHHQVIFEAFRQADGTTNRKYGGTGLGLSISRELTALLGGEIRLRSTPGAGSTFTVVVPASVTPSPVERHTPQEVAPAPLPRAPLIADDREVVNDRRTVLVIEDDPAFAEILRDLGRELGFRCVVAGDAAEGLRLASAHAPAAVILDLGLPDHSGMTVLELLKRDPLTRHVPIHVVSVHDYQQIAREMGAVGYALKPVKRDELVAAFRRLEDQLARRVRRVLIVEDDGVQRDAIAALVAADGVEITTAPTAEAALGELRTATFDCCVLDLGLPGTSGFAMLDRMAEDTTCSFPPVIVYTARALTADEELRLRRRSRSIIVKGARSPERLLEEVTLFLHRAFAELPAEQQRMLRAVRDREKFLESRRILVVEDDVRNIFALTKVLEPKGAAIEIARNGLEALARLDQPPALDLVLMDIMMPEMDGLTAMREIRKRDAHRGLPILALTSKAMPDDRQACLAAGASDYIAKPIDVEKLLSLLRVWMPR